MLENRALIAYKLFELLGESANIKENIMKRPETSANTYPTQSMHTCWRNVWPAIGASSNRWCRTMLPTVSKFYYWFNYNRLHTVILCIVHEDSDNGLSAHGQFSIRIWLNVFKQSFNMENTTFFLRCRILGKCDVASKFPEISIRWRSERCGGCTDTASGHIQIGYGRNCTRWNQRHQIQVRHSMHTRNVNHSHSLFIRSE